MAVSRKELAATFFRIGLTAYGGPAIVARIRQVVVLEKGWVREEDFQESLAFCQMLPGALAVQTAAHIGWRLCGGVGGVLALTCYVSPSIVLMLGLSAAYFHLGRLPVVTSAFRGLAAVIVAIVVDSILNMTRPALRDWRGVAIAAACAVGFFAGVSTLAVLLAAALVGVLWRLSRGSTDSREGSEPPPADPISPALGPASYGKTLAGLAVVAALLALGILGSGRISAALPGLGATMAKINLLAFGGGYTAIALMYQEAVVNPAHDWLTRKEFIDGLALGQVTPGPVIVTATFIGYRVAGWLGACFATVCVFLPSALLLVGLAPQFARVSQSMAARSAVRGLLAAFVAMLLYVLAHVAKGSFEEPWAPAVVLAAVFALRRNVSVVWVILVVVAGSIVFLR